MDWLESIEVSILFEDVTLGVSTVQRVVEAVGFVGSFWSRHLEKKHRWNRKSMIPDTVVSDFSASERVC